MTIEPAAPDNESEKRSSVPVALPQPTGAICANCGTPLYGEHCYHCGQPLKGLVRRFSSVLGDIADTLFEIDTRLTRTLLPLLLRPGYLSCEYFAGRRVRYVSPVRLFFFMSVLAFLVAQWTIDAGNAQPIQIESNGIDTAMTVADVQQQSDAALLAIRATLGAAAAHAPGAQKGLSEAEAAIHKQADRRIAELNAAKAKGMPPPKHLQQLTFGDDGKPWDPVTNPLKFDALPAVANRWLNQMVGRTQGNIMRIRQDPTILWDAWMSAVPSTLFLLLPLFAAMLKMTYLFKRRLYMEHFIVALHSHAFLCFALLLVLVLNGLGGVMPGSWLHLPLLWAQILLYAWMPLYLLLMQKRVYQQGWIMTGIKYCVLAVVYMVLLSIGAALSLLVKLVWL